MINDDEYVLTHGVSPHNNPNARGEWTFTVRLESGAAHKLTYIGNWPEVVKKVKAFAASFTKAWDVEVHP